MGFLDDLCDEDEYAGLTSLNLTGWQPCFEDTVLLAPVYIASVFLCLWRGRMLKVAPAVQREALDKWLSLVGAAASSVNLVSYVLLLAAVDDLGTYEYIVAVLGILSWLSAAVVVYMERERSVPGGQWTLRFCWLWVFVCSCVRMNTQTEMPSGEDINRVLLFWLQFFSQAVLVLSSYFDKRPLLVMTANPNMDDDGLEMTSVHPLDLKQVTEEAGSELQLRSASTKHPSETAGLFSRLTFFWMNRLVFFGYKNNLTDADVWDLPKRFEAGEVSARFEAAWADEQARAKRRGDGNASLLGALKAVLGRRFAMAGPLLLVQNLSQLALPVILGELLEFLGDESRGVEEGYVLSVLFFAALMLMTVAENAYFDRVVSTGVELRSALVTAIYRKALRMSNNSRQDRTTGAIVNHMATDTDKLQMQTMVLHNVWSSPTRIFLGMALLINGLGWAGVIGFVCVLLLIPVQGKIMVRMQMLLKKVMGHSDKRIKLVNEILAGMRVIKYYAWEGRFLQKLNVIRDEELNQLYKSQIMRALVFFLMKANPVALSVGTFVAFALLDSGSLTPSKAFMALSLFTQLLWPLMMLPRTISSIIEAQVSLARVEGYLQCEELQQAERPKSGTPHISIKDATFRWETDQPTPTLADVNLEVENGKLVAVIGGTGSGKSSLLSAMLGEVERQKGEVVLDGSVAYVAQQAWIYNATVRDNILFGLPFDEQKYWNAIRISSLETDINHQFAAGDQTEIGERGISLSGGQKQRISIARAVYADADVYLLDDPLSALDAHVGSDVFKECFARGLAGKTRVLVTNQLQYLPQVDHVVVLKDGVVAEQGTYEQLMKDGQEFAVLMREQGGADEGDAGEGKADGEGKEGEAAAAAAEEAKAAEPRKRAASAAEKTAKIVAQHKEDGDKSAEGRLTTAEKRATGSVKWQVYRVYVAAIGNVTFLTLMLCYLGGIACNLGASIWLSEWADHPEDSALYYAGIYAALSSAQVLLGLWANITSFRGSVRASRVLHSRLMAALLAAPMYFFDMTPMGRIVNRFTKDMSQLDTQIMFNLALLLSSMFDVLGTLTIIGLNTPYVIVVAVPVIGLFIWVQNFYRKSSVQLKRMDSVSRSPVYAHFTETLTGMSTIRAYDAQNRMSATNAFKVDSNQKIYLTSMTANRWLSIRLEFLGGLLIMCASVNCVLLRDSLSPSEAGVAMAYTLTITTLLNTLVRFTTEVEGSFNSVERINEYCALAPEAARIVKPGPPDSWPAEGRIEIEQLVMSYRPGLPPVLKGLSVSIGAAEKIGVVGRTGAGKSTLFQCLFRMAEASSGSVKFDDLDISGVGLEQLRSRIAIIPQDPVLFAQDVRFNLDPFEIHEDHELWEALEKANLKVVIETSGKGLGMPVSENGENFSVGQRQLLCLARALLRKSKILVLDECTANVDVETDALLQATIRENFADRTTLTIAHRLNTIIDADKVLVLGLGQVLEFDTPAALLANPESEFSSMVNETGEANATYLKRAALGEVDLMAEERALAAAAAERLAAAQPRHKGPLMVAVDEAATTLEQGFNERKADKWIAELQEAEISPELWMEHLATLVHEVQKAATRAMEEDGIDPASFRRQGGMDSFVVGMQ